ncbi:MAG: hypothetical protein CBD27_08330 [Rhodospirillaceae bacterium TMED167]|nr:MAG: hypothetical protein CBD27_08330 [Rhodospirillaceae bacterium TMED167]
MSAFFDTHVLIKEKGDINMIKTFPKIAWVERLLADVEVMTMEELLDVEREQQRLEREIDRGYEAWVNTVSTS